MSDAVEPIIVGLGEALFDVYPDRAVLGGAPLNVAVHAHQLIRLSGGQGVVASRVGNDDHGRRLDKALTERRMDNRYLQLDPVRPTGQVMVALTEGEPTYDIRSRSAWDAMQFDNRWSDLAQSCHAVCFGTLAQRSALSREAVHRFLTTATGAIKLFDVNLRQTYFGRDVVEQSLQLADAAKFNDSELAQIVQLLKMPAGPDQIEPQQDALQFDESLRDRQCVELQERYALRLLARTRGSAGTVLYIDGQRYEHDPVECPAITGADAVGAGDACSAGLLVGLLLKWQADQTLRLANQLGAFVASVPGATPMLPESILTAIK